MMDLPTVSNPAVVVEGDCQAVLPTIPAESFDAVVTDPPYGLSFMGKEWDHGVPGVGFWAAILRVVKPGSYLAAMGGTRTHHRLMVAIEDAGFEIRDCLSWLYGTGFPKGHGCLKPAWEPIVLARKPGPKVLPLGVNECRVPLAGESPPSGSGDRRGGDKYAQDEWTRTRMFNGGNTTPDAGRWPANVVHDGSDEVMEAFAAFGEKTSGAWNGKRTQPKTKNTFGAFDLRDEKPKEGDTGTAARFFYCAKASKAERGEGNTHPTVKPLALMRWLVRLVCPPGGLILDPFCGSGSTVLAATAEGRRCVGVERFPEYVEVARRRIMEAAAEPKSA